MRFCLPKLKVSTLRTYGDTLVDHFSCSQLPAHCCKNLRMVKELVIKEQVMGGHQIKISDVFTPCSSTNLAGPINNAPRVSSSPATSEIEYEDGHETIIASDSDLPMIISDFN